jgi:hypothetical protein
MVRLNPTELKGRLRAAFECRANELHPGLFAQHHAVFEAIRNPDYENFALYPCFVDGVATSAIVAIERTWRGFVVVPLFIAPYQGMEFRGHDWQETVEYPE